MARRVLVALLLLALAAGAGTLRAALDRHPAQARRDTDLLYLPNGRHLQSISLGHAPLLADLVYLWAIQYYSNYDRADRYRYVKHVFSNVITELDPHYVDAYWLGALILIVEAKDFDGGIQLLDKGVRANPDSWILPYVAGWESYRVGHYETAGSYFDQAARVPDAPPVVRRMRAGMLGKAGSLREAIRLWGELLQDPATDDRSRAIAGRQIRDLQVRQDILDLEAALSRFRTENGRAANDLAELQARSYIGGVPRDPDGRAYRYDPQNGRVSSSAEQVLRNR